MPKAPALVGKLAQSMMGRRARVLGITEVAPGFLELEFHADPPPGGWQPGQEVQVRATSTEGRRYSVRQVVDPHRIRVLAALDGGGPGTSWIRALRPGAETVLIAGRHVPLRLPGSRRLCLGDGAALGTFDAYAQGGQSPLVAVEVPPESVARLRERWPGYRFLPAVAAEAGAASQAWLEDALDHEALIRIDGALLLGHAQSIQRQRHTLVTREVLDRRAISTKPYWATGKAGL